MAKDPTNNIELNVIEHAVLLKQQSKRKPRTNGRARHAGRVAAEVVSYSHTQIIALES